MRDDEEIIRDHHQEPISDLEFVRNDSKNLAAGLDKQPPANPHRQRAWFVFGGAADAPDAIPHCNPGNTVG